MLPEESIPEILSLMRTVDFMNQTEDQWKHDAEISAQSAHYNQLVQHIFSFMTPAEKDQILELYRNSTSQQNNAA